MQRNIVPDSDQSDSDAEIVLPTRPSAPLTATKKVPAPQIIDLDSDDDAHAAAPAVKENALQIFDFADDLPKHKSIKAKSASKPTESKKRKREPAAKEVFKAVKSKELITSSDDDIDLIDLGVSQRRAVKTADGKTSKPRPPSSAATRALSATPKPAPKARARPTLADYSAEPDDLSTDEELAGRIQQKMDKHVKQKQTKKASDERQATVPETVTERPPSSAREHREAAAMLPTPVSPLAVKPSPRTKDKPVLKARQQQVAVGPPKNVPFEASVKVAPAPLQAVVNEASKSVSVPAAASKASERAATAAVPAMPAHATKAALKEGQVLNYAATKAINIATRPRMAAGLSRRQRVEPLHKFIKK